MTRSLASISVAIMLATAAAQAQCFTNAGGTSHPNTPPGMFSVWGGYPIPDEGRSVLAVPLGFTFPMPTTAPGQTCDRMWIGTNGVIYLSDANYGLVNPVQYLIQDIASLRSTAFGSPRLLPYSRDLDASQVGGSAWDILLNTSTPGQVTVTFKDEARWTNTTDQFSFSATLYNTGIIDYSWDGNVPTDGAWVGLSVGNGVGTGNEVASNLNSANSGNLGLLYGVVNAGSEVANKTIRFAPNGIGGYTTSVLCSAAFHASYGVGCYGPQALQAIYQNFATPAAASALTGQSMVATPTGTGYVFTWGGGAYIPPSGLATPLALTDDSEVDVTPSIPFPTPTGPVATLSVNSNAFVNMGPVGQNYIFAYGSVFELLNTTIPAFRMNSDYDPGSSPIGAVLTEEVTVGSDTILCVTLRDIERYGATSNPDRLQFQLNLNSGQCTYVWDAMTSTSGGAHVVGYSPSVSLDPGSIDLATALPKITSPDYNGVALALSASPPPVYTVGGSTVPITYTVDNMIDVAPPFGIGVGLLIFSVAPFPGGLDMTFLGINACNLNIASLDVMLNLPNTAPQASVVLTIPQPLFPGLSFYSQAVSLFDPNNPLPNGQNPFGAILSNGLQSFFNLF